MTTPHADNIVLNGNIVAEYPVDESQDNSNAGDAIEHEWKGYHVEVITWNALSLDHDIGEIAVSKVWRDDDESDL